MHRTARFLPCLALAPVAAWARPESRAYMAAMSVLRVSVLDQTPIAEGDTAADALRNTLELAGLADALGFHRYWLAEHHASRSLAGVAPEALIGPVALATRRIRLTSAKGSRNQPTSRKPRGGQK